MKCLLFIDRNELKWKQRTNSTVDALSAYLEETYHQTFNQVSLNFPYEGNEVVYSFRLNNEEECFAQFLEFLANLPWTYLNRLQLLVKRGEANWSMYFPGEYRTITPKLSPASNNATRLINSLVLDKDLQQQLDRNVTKEDLAGKYDASKRNPININFLPMCVRNATSPVKK
jgi:hypothetical protein